MAEDDVQAHLEDGRTLHFPAGTDPGVIQITVKKLMGNGFNGQTGYSNVPGFNAPAQDERQTIPLGESYNIPEDQARSIIKHTPEALPMIGGSFGGPIGRIGGAAAGSILGQVLKNFSPKLFSQDDQAPSLGDSATQVGLDTVTQGVLPSALGGVLKLATPEGRAALMASKIGRQFPAVRNSLGDSISQSLYKIKYPESSVIETAAQNAQDSAKSLGPLGIKNNPNFSEGTVGKDLLDIPYEQTQGSTNSISKVADKALSDVTQVRNFKLATGEPGTIEKLAVNKVLTKGFNGEKFDPAVIRKELNGDQSDVYNEAIRPAARKLIDSTLDDLQKYSPSSGNGSNILNYSKNRLILSLPLIATGVATGHGLATAAGAGSLLLTNHVFSRLLANPETAALVSQAAKSSLDIPQAGMIQKALLNSLRGAEVYFLSPDGKQEPAQIGQDGSVQYRRP